MNDKRTLIAIRKVLANWNLNCAEESCLKKELANELLWAVKNCNAPAVSKCVEPVGEVTVCSHPLEHRTYIGRNTLRCGLCGLEFE